MNVSQVWQTWLHATTRPSEATFEAERQQPNATLATALIWMLIAGAITAVIGMLQATLAAGAASGTVSLLLDVVHLPPAMHTALRALLSVGSVAGLSDANIGSIITLPLGFLISVTIFHWIARLLGGVGSYGRYAYLNAAFSAPLNILTAAISIIPYVNLLEIVIIIYQFVLIYYATKVEHRLTRGKTLLVILLPVLVVLALIACAAVFAGAILIRQYVQ